MRRRRRRGLAGLAAFLAATGLGFRVQLERLEKPPPDQGRVTRRVDELLGSRWRLVVDVGPRTRSARQSVRTGLVRASDRTLWERVP